MIEIFIKASSARWLKASLINMKRKAINTHYYTIRIQMFTVCTTPHPVKKLGTVQRLKPAKSNIYARLVAGLFFCLASAEDAGLLFLPCCNMPKYKRLQCVLCSQCSKYRPRRKTAHRALQALFLRLCQLNRRIYQTDTRGYNAACATLERITAPGRPTPIPDTNATPDAVQASTAALL
jgi:hypothetical protein